MAKGIKDRITETNLGYKGQQPPAFDLGGNSTIHYTSEIDNKPAFPSYKSSYLKRQHPTKLSAGIPVKYLDNLPG